MAKKVEWRRVWSIRVHPGIKDLFERCVGRGSASQNAEAALYLWSKLSPEKRSEWLKNTDRFVEKAREVEVAEHSADKNIDQDGGIVVSDSP